VRLLCIVCTVKTNRFYIPGETKLVERLRKDAYDKGIFATLTFLYQTFQSQETSGGRGKFTDIKNYIRDKVLNLIELNDLFYHANVIDQLIEILKQDPNAFKSASEAIENPNEESATTPLRMKVKTSSMTSLGLNRAGNQSPKVAKRGIPEPKG
jgi:hypothetical protein